MSEHRPAHVKSKGKRKGKVQYLPCDIEPTYTDMLGIVIKHTHDEVILVFLEELRKAAEFTDTIRRAQKDGCHGVKLDFDKDGCNMDILTF